MKNVLNWLLVLCLCVCGGLIVPGLSPLKVYAVSGGDNTPVLDADGVYQISSADELMWFAAHVNDGNSGANAVLLDDIDLGGKTWTPIGKDADVAYTGSFDGKFHRIKNMNISAGSAGLFGHIDTGAVISNTIIDSTCSVTGSWAGGGLVGSIVNMGGVTIKNCGNEATVVATSSSSGRAGGIVGSISGGDTGSQILNCYNTGNIDGAVAAGGIGGSPAKWAILPEFKNCYNAGEVTGNGVKHAIYGVKDAGGELKLSNCYSLNTTDNNVTSFTADELANGKLTYNLNGAELEGVWKQTIGVDSYPNFTGKTVHYSESEENYYNDAEPLMKDGFYQIKTADELMWFAAHVNDGNSGANAVLLDDIDLDGKTWMSIGKDTNVAYTGSFDGKFHRIKNMNISAGSAGLFGHIDTGAVISNTIIDSTCSVSGSWSGGGLVGSIVNKGGVTIKNCGNEATVVATSSSSGTAGGIVGSISGGDTGSRILNCYNTGNINGAVAAGGIGGSPGKWAILPEFKNCYNAGEVTGNGVKHAIYGVKDAGGELKLSNCYSLNTTDNNVTSFTADELANGKLTYNLNGAESEGVWKQTIGVDARPNYTGQTVYYWPNYDGYNNNESAPEALVIEGGDRTLNPGNIRYLNYVDNKNGAATDIQTDFISSDDAVATVTADGTLTAIGLGEATITLARGGYTTQINVEVVEDTTEADIVLMKQRMFDYIMGIGSSNPAYPEIVAENIQQLSDQANTIWQTMYKPGTGQEYLWDQTDKSGGVPATSQFGMLQTLAKAFLTEGTTLYQNAEVGRALLDALEYMTGTGDYEGINYTWTYDGEITSVNGNWWDWQIGAGQRFSYILLIMEDYLEDEEIVRYTDIVNTYAYDPQMQLASSGYFGQAETANMCDIAHCVLIQGLLRNNEEQIKLITKEGRVSTAMIPKKGYTAFNDENYGDGRLVGGGYEDGSYIDHHCVAYTGSYGSETLKGVAVFCYVLGGTKYDFAEDTITSYLDYVLEAYLPLLYKGKMMSMVNGRAVAISRTGQGSEISLARGVMYRMLMLCKNVDERYKNIIEGVIKYNLEEWVKYYGEEILRNEVMFYEILDDDSVQSMTYLDGIKLYGAMCRTVQATDDYTAGLSLSRKHIASYEGISGQNIRGFYQGAGALYVYNNDLDQFGVDYWPTQDPYRMAGVTADTTPLSVEFGNAWPPTTPENEIASGASDGNLAAIAYEFNGSHLNLNTLASKSYFFLEEGIVQMGTNIHGTTNATIETTIDGRMLNDEGTNKVLINGEEFIFDGTRQKVHLDAGSWIHMEGNCDGADMAYYFPEAIDIEIQKELRKGSYKDINTSENSDEYSRWYLYIGINHGSGTVSDGQYLFVTLPGMSVEEIEAYAVNNTLKIVDGTVDGGNKNAHFIKNNNDTMMAVNYFGEDTYKADWLTLDSEEGDCISIIVTEDVGTYTLNIADPTYTNTKLSIASDYKMNVVSKSDEITVADDNMSFAVDTTDAGGHSFKITFTLEGKESTIVWPTAENTSFGKTLADVQLNGGSNKGSFAWAEPETVPQVGTNYYTLVYTSTEGKTYTREILVTVVEISDSDEGDTGDNGSGSDEKDTETPGSGSTDTGNTDTSSTESGSTDSGSTHFTTSATDVNGTVANKTVNTPQTGDTSRVDVMTISMLLCIMGILALVWHKKVNKDV